MTSSEASELAASALHRLVPRLPGVAAPDDAPADLPTRHLYELVAQRLRADGEQEALAELVRDPRNNSLVKRLLATAATKDPGYAEKLAAAVRALPPDPDPAPPAAPARPAEPAPPAATAPTAEPAPPAGARLTSDGPSAGTPQGRRPRRYGPWVGVGAVVLLLLVGVLVTRAVVGGLTDAGGLTSESSCTDYRQAPPEERVAAIRQIGLAKGISGVDSPLVMTAVDQLCDAQPSARIGDLIARFDD